MTSFIDKHSKPLIFTGTIMAFKAATIVLDQIEAIVKGQFSPSNELVLVPKDAILLQLNLTSGSLFGGLTLYTPEMVKGSFFFTTIYELFANLFRGANQFASLDQRVAGVAQGVRALLPSGLSAEGQTQALDAVMTVSSNTSLGRISSSAICLYEAPGSSLPTAAASILPYLALGAAGAAVGYGVARLVHHRRRHLAKLDISRTDTMGHLAPSSVSKKCTGIRQRLKGRKNKSVPLFIPSKMVTEESLNPTRKVKKQGK